MQAGQGRAGRPPGPFIEKSGAPAASDAGPPRNPAPAAIPGFRRPLTRRNF